jgi:tetratricopeptide (TPR) repeat protein
MKIILLHKVTLIFLFIIQHISYLQAQQEPEYEKAYKTAIQFFDANNPDEGFKYLNKSLELNPGFYDALYARSFYFMENEQYENALKDYDVLLILYPDKPEWYLYKGQAKMSLQRYEEAEKEYLLALAIDSVNTDVINSLGSLYYIVDLYEEAKGYFNQVLKLDAKNHFAYYHRALVQYQLEKYDSTLADVGVCLKIDSTDLDAHRLKAMTFIEQKKYKTAIDIFEALQKKDVDFEEEDFYYWGLAYYKMNQYEDALFYYELPESHKNPDLYYQMGRTQYRLNNSKEALDLMSKAIQYYDSLSEESAKVFYDRSVVKYRLQDWEGARKDFLYANYLMPEIWEQKDSRGKKIDLLLDAYLALKMDKQRMTIDSMRLAGFQDRAEAYLADGDAIRAWTQSNKALALDSLDSYTFTIQASVQLLEGDLSQAMALLEKSETLKKNQNAEKIYYVKGLVFNEIGNFGEAKKSFEKAVEINPNEAHYWSDLGNACFELDKYKEAWQHIQKAIALDSTDMEYLNERAMYALALKDFDNALKDSHKVLEKNKDNASALYNRGLAYKGLAKKNEAIKDFEQLLKIFPEDTEIQRILQELKK